MQKKEKKLNNDFCPRCCTFDKYVRKFRQKLNGKVCKKCRVKTRSKNELKVYKENARKVTQYAIRIGFLKKEPCRKCGKKISIHSHHPNYRNPLNIWWLCAKHHRQTHCFLSD